MVRIHLHSGRGVYPNAFALGILSNLKLPNFMYNNMKLNAIKLPKQKFELSDTDIKEKRNATYPNNIFNICYKY